MKKSLFFFCLFLIQLVFAQSKDSIFVHEEVNKLKSLRAKDSAKIELLLQEIKNLVQVSESQQKENNLRFKQIIDSVSRQKQMDLI